MAEATPTPIVHLDVEARQARGRGARQNASRSSHAAWHPTPDRPDPVELIAGQEVTRVPELLPIRHERMLASPFTFYRGAAIIMAADLATQPDTGLRVQACGDAHLANFGGFMAPDRTTVFDMNDFDETNPGPFEWDVKRLVDELRARVARDRHRREGRPQDRRQHRARVPRRDGRVRRRCATSTSGTPASTSTRCIARWSSQVSAGGDRALPEATSTSRSRKDSMKALAKLTEVVDGEHRIKSATRR